MVSPSPTFTHVCPYASDAEWAALQSRLVRNSSSIYTHASFTAFDFALFRRAVKMLQIPYIRKVSNLQACSGIGDEIWQFLLVPFKDYFPTEVIDEIFSHLTEVKDLVACKQVSRQFSASADRYLFETFCFGSHFGVTAATSMPNVSFRRPGVGLSRRNIYSSTFVDACSCLEQESYVSDEVLDIFLQLRLLRDLAITFVGNTSPLDTESLLTLNNVTAIPVPLAPLASLFSKAVNLQFVGGRFGSRSTPNTASAAVAENNEASESLRKLTIVGSHSHLFREPSLALSLKYLFELNIQPSANDTWDTLYAASISAPNLAFLTFKIRSLETDPRLAGWTPVNEADIDQVSAIANTISALDISLDEEFTKTLQDDPMGKWRPLATLFLNEMVRSDGLGGLTGCTFCPANVGSAEARFFRCKQCGEHIYCEECVKRQHKRHPLHDIRVRESCNRFSRTDGLSQEWTGEFWTEVSLFHRNTNSSGRLGLGCVCARHGLVRRRGLGDLQKGERYANVDWILLCTLWAERLLEYGFAYDIICQWIINFFDRLAKIRESEVDTSTLAVDIDEADLHFGLPVWHAGAHQAECRAHLALAYMLRMGKTDGEAMERIWAALNPASWATKEMGEGARHDVLEDKIDKMNFEKDIGLGKTLARKLIVAIAERRQQGLEFAELDKSVKRAKREEWRAKMDEWYEDQDTDSPFIVAGGEASGPSQRSIGEELRQAELDDARAGHVPFVEGSKTGTAFVQAGLQLEESQRRIRAALKNKSLTATRRSEIQELRMSLLKKLASFEKLQLTYMPGAAALREADNAKRDPDQPPPQPETLRLYLPSDLSDEDRLRACVRRVVETEAGLRRGQCADALIVLRARLYAQMHLIWFRDMNWVGQRARTRSATLMARLGEAIERIADKYRRARAALVELKGAAFAPEFQELEDVHLNCRLETESDAAAVAQLRSADGSRATRSEPNARRNYTTRCESGWSKARARKYRWDEEVEIVREEMKRVLRSLLWEQTQWQAMADRSREDVEEHVAAGLRARGATAAQQADKEGYVSGRMSGALKDGSDSSVESTSLESLSILCHAADAHLSVRPTQTLPHCSPPNRYPSTTHNPGIDECSLVERVDERHVRARRTWDILRSSSVCGANSTRRKQR
ncbi:CxC2 domain-containing protein [Mycena chlorophos]|uniref:CxC2 domain-containing protein n=1 Tax=Mycena chlorophos TaxID=658473 RepID=A0A8H6TLH2_MYCCL|nr:CxC2 domain-containing protein [Mycena chlorophos]